MLLDQALNSITASAFRYLKNLRLAEFVQPKNKKKFYAYYKIRDTDLDLKELPNLVGLIMGTETILKSL